MEKAFQDQKLYIGIDVHKKNWVVSIIGEFSDFKTFSQPPQAKVLYHYLEKNFPGGEYHAVYEAGFCGFHICKQLQNLGINCIVVNPADVPTKDKEKKRKSDSVDSKKLAKSLRAHELEAIFIPSEQVLQDRALLRFRNKLTSDQTRCKNRIKSFLFFNGINIPYEYSNTNWSKAFIKWIEQQSKHYPTLRLLLNQLLLIQNLLSDTNKSIYKLAKTQAYSKYVALLRSIPGIGILSAINILIEIADIRRFSSIDKLSAFVGLIPNTHSSGEKEIMGNMTARGNTQIKKYLIEASWTIIRKDPEMMAYFGKLCKRMNKNRAIIRIAKKLLTRIRAILITEQPYLINYNL